jgi:hypothetical protein
VPLWSWRGLCGWIDTVRTLGGGEGYRVEGKSSLRKRGHSSGEDDSAQR